jgi:hypothetical protein
MTHFMLLILLLVPLASKKPNFQVAPQTALLCPGAPRIEKFWEPLVSWVLGKSVV